MDVVVTGIGLISALGSLRATWQGLLAGKSGIQSRQPFAQVPPRPIALVNQTPATLSQLTQHVVADAIADAGLVPPLPECGVVVGSSRGNQALWEQMAREQWQEARELRGSVQGETALIPSLLPPVPSNWLETLPHAATVIAARQVHTTAIALSPMAACATGLWAIAQGADLIRTGQYLQVIAGGVEAPITPLTLAGFAQMGALAPTGAYPFDRDREGLVLAEGGAVLVLESAAAAAQRGATVYGRILGAGLTADGYHVSAPEPQSRAAIAAVQQCLTRSGLSHHDIDYIHAHGTATRLNDRHEAHLIQSLFPPGVAVSSTKGATGHAIGASGALGAAFCLMALKHQRLPPCVGLTQPDFALNFVVRPQSCSVKATLCLSFGFGGQNAAIAFAAASEAR